MCEIQKVPRETAVIVGFFEMNGVEDDHSHVSGIKSRDILITSSLPHV